MQKRSINAHKRCFDILTSEMEILDKIIEISEKHKQKYKFLFQAHVLVCGWIIRWKITSYQNYLAAN